MITDKYATPEALKAAIIANPHLRTMIEHFHAEPELAIQTFANELEVPVPDVAEALGVTIEFWTEEDKKRLHEEHGIKIGGTEIAEVRGHRIARPFAAARQAGKVVEAAAGDGVVTIGAAEEALEQLGTGKAAPGGVKPE